MVEVPVVFRDELKRATPASWLKRGTLDAFIEFSIGGIEHEINEVGLAWNMGVEGHGSHAQSFRHIPHRQGIHAFRVCNVYGSSHNGFQRQARTPRLGLGTPKESQTSGWISR